MKTIMALDDKAKQLVEKAKCGDRGAFDRLVREYEPRFVRIIQARLGRPLSEKTEVQDILQEALLRAFRSLQNFHWRQEDAFVSWTAGIIENVIRTQSQRHGRGEFLELHRDLPGGQSSPSKHVRREERFDRLEDALNTLSPEHREVIILARIERMRIKEIAERMKRSPDAVKQLLVRALRKLREAFGDTESLHLPPRKLEGDRKRD
jgi:RNA polymerase sigma-70 factor (ECF subfamily)